MIFALEAFLWSGPLLLGLMGCHIYFTLRLRGVQRYTLRGIRLSLGKGEGTGVSAFGALSTSLAAAMGTGNIIGVATAVAMGGPGAVFWCWVTGILGMATRYGETYLALKYRRSGGRGGAMYILSDRLKQPWLGKLFCLLGVAAALGTGAMIQSNALGSCLAGHGVPLLPTMIMSTILAGAVLLGGVKKIAAVCEKLVPAMGLLYISGCLGVIYVNRGFLWEAICLIIREALMPRSLRGGGAGSAVMAAMRYGVARGLFTNEAGMGTSPMASAAGPCRSPEAEALAAMTGVLWDTVVVCAMTGIALVSAMVASPRLFAGAEPGSLCSLAFSCVPGGGQILTVSLCVFAFATIVGWSWYGSCCGTYLGGKGGNRVYLMLYLAAVFCGGFLKLEALWSLGSILAGLMAIPNVYALLRLRKEILPPKKEGSKGKSAMSH